jgi:rhodanese-related sulfurtransferase
VVDELVTAVRDKGLGNSAYLVDLGDGRALAVDVSRDLRAVHREAETRRLRITHAADTHLHADFLTGAVQLAATAGAQIIASKLGGRRFDHRGLEDGDEVDLGGLTLRALATPGHTDEHLSFLLLDGTREIGVFTGGSLILGSAARVDLVDPGRTEEMARAQYHSLRRLSALPDQTILWPTHGSGSFCSLAANTAGASSTIGAERATNPLLRAPDEETFVRQLLDALGSFPPYFLRLGNQNRDGPRVLASPPVLDLIAPAAAAREVRRGAVLVDVRPVASFARGHPFGAVSIPLRPAFASWLGWLAPPDRPLLVLREPDQDADEILWQALKIGYENIRGEVAGGIDAWVSAGLPTATVPLTRPEDTEGLRLLDVRQSSEFEHGHLAGARHIELGDLTSRLHQLPDEPTVVMCGHGERAMGAASLLQAAGFRHVSVLDGGPEDVAAVTGLALEPGA